MFQKIASPNVTRVVYDVIMKTTNLCFTGEYLIYRDSWVM